MDNAEVIVVTLVALVCGLLGFVFGYSKATQDQCEARGGKYVSSACFAKEMFK